MQDYAGRARTEQGLNLEHRHLNVLVLVLGMRYRRFDEVVKGRGDAAVRNGLGDWLARQEGYDKRLCQWVEAVWSKSLGLATDIELDSKAHRRRAEEEKRRKGDERARRRSVEEQARRREAEVRRQEEAPIDGRAGPRRPPIGRSGGIADSRGLSASLSVCPLDAQTGYPGSPDH